MSTYPQQEAHGGALDDNSQESHAAHEEERESAKAFICNLHAFMGAQLEVRLASNCLGPQQPHDTTADGDAHTVPREGTGAHLTHCLAQGLSSVQADIHTRPPHDNIGAFFKTT